MIPDAKKLTLLQRLNAVQDEVDYVQKERKAGMRYSIVSHDAVTAKVRPLMVKYGVLYYPVAIDMEQIGNRTQLHMSVRFVNVDDAADFIDVCTAGYGIDEQDKGPGKAISYAVKYALLKALGLESGDDPDEDQDVTFRDKGYPTPPLKPSGQPQTGYRKDGAATPHSLNKSGVWQAEFMRELNECKSLPMLETFRWTWSKKAETDKWPAEWKELAVEEIRKHRVQLSAPAPDDDTFPGDRIGGGKDPT